MMFSKGSQRVISGMRPTGRLHLGHYHGVLKNWLKLQHEYECFFFIADLHALTTHFEHSETIGQHVWDMLIDWLSVGIYPGSANIFLQSWIPEISELQLILSMITPLSWLERVPTYKDQQEKIREVDLATHGFLGYPLLQTADILLYKGRLVPVGEDQIPHIELARDIARRFNHMYGNEDNAQELAEKAQCKLGKRQAARYEHLRKHYQEQGDLTALEMAKALIQSQQAMTLNDKERLHSYLEGRGLSILIEPEALLTEQSRLTGLDGQKMSKSYHNTIALREDLGTVSKKIRTMPTDPARIKRNNPGDPEKCPVWALHQVYTSSEVQTWVNQGCRSAGIGCIDCKQPLIDAICQELKPIQEQAKDYENNPTLLKQVLNEGSEKARAEAQKTLAEVRKAVGLIE